MSLTLSVTYKCNSHCKTCNIHNKKADELSLEEWARISRSVGRNIFWITMSGGEPFLRGDLSEIVSLFYEECRPSVINIPTNGILTDRISGAVQRIATQCSQACIIVNISIDDVGEKHDTIRGVPGNYEKAVETFKTLKGIGLSNLSVGIHTVISRYNVSNIPQIFEAVISLSPDSYVTEIAEEREELDTIGADIVPQYEDYAKAVDYLSEVLKQNHFDNIGGVTKAFRTEYYQMVKKILRERHQVIPCFAGFASGQIAPDGEVWMCCTKAKSIGSLRDVDYDFREIWFSEKAHELRRKIKNGDCFCPLANAAYTNMLLNPGALRRVGMHYLKSKISNPIP
jgi:MoaA/NifB/PqqE/SkfB family radical SAM enzyme